MSYTEVNHPSHQCFACEVEIAPGAEKMIFVAKANRYERKHKHHHAIDMVSDEPGVEKQKITTKTYSNVDFELRGRASGRICKKCQAALRKSEKFAHINGNLLGLFFWFLCVAYTWHSTTFIIDHMASPLWPEGSSDLFAVILRVLAMVPVGLLYGAHFLILAFGVVGVIGIPIVFLFWILSIFKRPKVDKSGKDIYRLLASEIPAMDKGELLDARAHFQKQISESSLKDMHKQESGYGQHSFEFEYSESPVYKVIENEQDFLEYGEENTEDFSKVSWNTAEDTKISRHPVLGFLFQTIIIGALVTGVVYLGDQFGVNGRVVLDFVQGFLGG